jgi:hypothetical protein
MIVTNLETTTSCMCTGANSETEELLTLHLAVYIHCCEELKPSMIPHIWNRRSRTRGVRSRDSLTFAILGQLSRNVPQNVRQARVFSHSRNARARDEKSRTTHPRQPGIPARPYGSIQSRVSQSRFPEPCNTIAILLVHIVLDVWSNEASFDLTVRYALPCHLWNFTMCSEASGRCLHSCTHSCTTSRLYGHRPPSHI